MAMRIFILTALLLGWLNDLTGQSRKEDIYTDYVLYNKRQRLENDLRANTIQKTFSQEINEDNEHKFESACSAICQFQFHDDTVKLGLKKMFRAYDSLQFPTRRALLEAAYAVFPSEFSMEIASLLEKETDPKLFALCASYLGRQDPSISHTNALKLRMVETFPEYDTTIVLLELEKHLNHLAGSLRYSLPPLKDLIQFEKNAGNKIIYSFQRWNRDYPGMAAVQNADGSFMRRADGGLLLFQQLARSGSGLPYFLTNGNTPQGIYRIVGTAVARNNFIGPTPNIQLIMPFEDSLEKFFQYKWDSSVLPLEAYKSLLPPSWRNYLPAQESFYAGRIGRSEIIAHGTTLDPEYFRDKPYYPLTPTLGCLCAKELWNITTGRLLVSEQFNLYSAFTATPGNKGYLIVINISDDQKAVTREEIEKIISGR